MYRGMGYLILMGHYHNFLYLIIAKQKTHQNVRLNKVNLQEINKM